MSFTQLGFTTTARKNVFSHLEEASHNQFFLDRQTLQHLRIVQTNIFALADFATRKISQTPGAKR